MPSSANPSRSYAVVTGSYWAFTLTDGALRMLVLLFLHGQGYSPFELASLFLFYEFFGVLTNYFGGLIGGKTGLKAALLAGLLLQVLSLLALGLTEAHLTVLFVMAAQAASGIAKDLVKMASKSWVKLVVPSDESSRLMRWVAVLTGSKNALKGIGFFLGGALLSTLGFATSLFALAALLVVAILLSVLLLPSQAGKVPARAKTQHLLSRDSRLNRLSLARFFLFGSRDIWFVVALPVFLSSSLGWSHSATGTALALWVVGYGIVQSATPRILKTGLQAPTASTARRWTFLLVPVLALLVLTLQHFNDSALVLFAGLALFGFVFALNSAVHSFLVVHWAKEENVSADVGFYYSANAAGRLVGTVLSGWLFQQAGAGTDGLLYCLVGALVFVLASFLVMPKATPTSVDVA